MRLAGGLAGAPPAAFPAFVAPPAFFAEVLAGFAALAGPVACAGACLAAVFAAFFAGFFAGFFAVARPRAAAFFAGSFFAGFFATAFSAFAAAFLPGGATAAAGVSAVARRRERFPAPGGGSVGWGGAASSGRGAFVARPATFFATGRVASPALSDGFAFAFVRRRPTSAATVSVARRARDGREAGQPELDAASRRVDGLDDERRASRPSSARRAPGSAAGSPIALSGT